MIGRQHKWTEFEILRGVCEETVIINVKVPHVPIGVKRKKKKESVDK